MYRSSTKLNLSLYRTEEQSKIIDEKYYYLQIRERHYRRLMAILQQRRAMVELLKIYIAKEYDVSASGQSRDVDISISPYWN